MEEDHERVRQTQKMLANVGNNSYARDVQNIPRDRFVFQV